MNIALTTLIFSVILWFLALLWNKYDNGNGKFFSRDLPPYGTKQITNKIGYSILLIGIISILTIFALLLISYLQK